MDKFGISTAMLSPVNAARNEFYAGTEKARGLVRANNESGAKIVRDRPDCFGLFASLPFTDQEGSLREIEYSLELLSK